MKKYALLLVVVIFTITAKGQDADKAPYAIKYDFFTHCKILNIIFIKI